MHIAVDVGGTFTDLVVHDDEGHVHGFKSPTTPADLTDGVFEGLKLIADARGQGLSDLLGDADRFSFGTTAATNAILEGNGARTALLTTRGFRETLLVREGGKDDTYNINQPYPPPYIPRALTFEIEERITSEGEIHTPLVEESIRAAIDHCRREKVEAVAVALLWAIANPVHELRVGEILAAELPGVPVSLGHRVNPCMREYRRTSATALDASLTPVVTRSIDRLESRLEENGFKGTLSFVTSNGGHTSTREILDKPVYLCFSGPSAAPEAGRRFAEIEEIGNGNVVTVDMGGTSFDVSIVTDGQIPMHREGRIAGHIFGVPSVEVHTIGAGGGSIARVDSGGFVHVGPESAGAMPGPACYGNGGERPTVTDANLVSGLMGTAFTSGKGFDLRPDLAEQVVTKSIAEPLGLSPDEAAALVTLGCEQNMVVAIEELTIKRGIDPREYVMMAGGSAAGLHAAAIARELGIRQVVVPAMGGVLSAFGILTGNVSFNFGRSLMTASDRFNHGAVNDTLAELEAQADTYLARMNVAPEDRSLRYTCEARYVGQVWELTVGLPGSRIGNREALEQLVENFHRAHEGVYSVRSETDAVEMTEWHVQAIGRLANVSIPEVSASADANGANPTSRRRAYLKEARDRIDVPVYTGTGLPTNKVLDGPLFIDDVLSTVVVPSDCTVRRSRYSSFVIELG
jgi:N-methylhydantoinase A